MPVSAKGMMATWPLRAWLGHRHTKHFDRTDFGKRSQCLQEGRQELCSHVRPERITECVGRLEENFKIIESEIGFVVPR